MGKIAYGGTVLIFYLNNNQIQNIFLAYPSLAFDVQLPSSLLGFTHW